MDDPGTKTEEEAKKTERSQTQPERQTSLSLTPEETQKREQNHGLCHTPKGCPGMPEGDREPDGGLPEDFGNCMK